MRSHGMAIAEEAVASLLVNDLRQSMPLPAVLDARSNGLSQGGPTGPTAIPARGG